MAPRSATASAPNGDSSPTITKRRRRRRMTTTSRSGAATGTGSTMATTPSHVNYDSIAGRIQGLVEGFAFAHGVNEQQALTALKKHLAW